MSSDFVTELHSVIKEFSANRNEHEKVGAMACVIIDLRNQVTKLKEVSHENSIREN